MSDLFPKPAAAQLDPKALPSTAAAPDTCGACHFTMPIRENLQAVLCTGLPPTPVVVGMQQTPAGMQPQIEGIRSPVPRNLPACALFRRKSALVV